MLDSFSSQQSDQRDFFIYQAVSYKQNRSLYDDMCCYHCVRVSPEMCECKQCSKLFCSKCYNEQKSCSNCKSVNFQKLPTFKQNSLYSIGFTCSFTSQGCNVIQNLIEMSKHELTCPYRTINNSPSKRSNNQNSTAASSKDQIDIEDSMGSSLTESHVIVNEGNDLSGLLNALSLDNSSRGSVRSAESLTIDRLHNVITGLKEEINSLKKVSNLPYKSLCPNGHPLVHYKYDHQQVQSILCDVCKTQPKDILYGTYRCSQCDFDRCECCFNRGRLY